MKNLQYIRQAQYKKGFIVPVLLAIIAVLVVGGGVYFYQNKKAEAPVLPTDTEVQETNEVEQQTNTQTNTSNWKTYTNTKYGFEFKYPMSGYKFSADNPSYTYLFGLSEFRAEVREDISTDDPEYLSNFHFFILTPTQPINDLTTYVRSAMDAPSGSSYKYISSQYLSINETQWLRVKANDDLGNEIYSYFLISGSKLYWMGLSGQSRADLEKIPSTFKFTPTVEKASGIIKSVYLKSGKNYIDIDYVELNPNWVPGGSGEQGYKNVNPLIRTFEVSSSAKFFTANGTSITFSDFKKYFVSSDPYVPISLQAANPWDIVITNGIVTQVKEHYIP